MRNITNINEILDAYKGIENKSKSEIFYFSLFDDSMFNESEFALYTSEQLVSLIRKTVRRKLKYNITEDQIHSMFFSGKVNNILLCHELGKRLKITANPSRQSNGKEIDGILSIGDNILFLENKRIYSASNIGDYLMELIDSYSDETRVSYKDKKVSKILGNFIFISESETNSSIVYRVATSGYRSLFSKLTDRGFIPKNMDFYMAAFHRYGSLDDFFEALCSRVKAVSKSIKG